MWSVLHSGNSQPGSSEDSIGDAMTTDSSSGSASVQSFFPKVISQSGGCKIKKKTLAFQLSYLDTYKWLAYSPSTEGGFCKFGILFPPISGQIPNGIFITLPFKNLRKAGGAKGKLHSHDTLKYH